MSIKNDTDVKRCLEAIGKYMANHESPMAMNDLLQISELYTQLKAENKRLREALLGILSDREEAWLRIKVQEPTETQAAMFQVLNKYAQIAEEALKEEEK